MSIAGQLIRACTLCKLSIKSARTCGTTAGTAGMPAARAGRDRSCCQTFPSPLIAFAEPGQRVPTYMVPTARSAFALLRIHSTSQRVPLQQAPGHDHRSLLRTQVDLVKTGKPFVMFGDGRLASCKPISEADLAAFMADCVMQQDKVDQVLPIGGKCGLNLSCSGLQLLGGLFLGWLCAGHGCRGARCGCALIHAADDYHADHSPGSSGVAGTARHGAVISACMPACQLHAATHAG